MDDEADYVVVGAGTAGCILATRLSEVPSARVVLLEAGPTDRDPWIHVPAGYARLLVSGRYDWNLATEPEPGLQGRSIRWPRGRVLGGSGSINGLAFLRGSPRDYDRWAQAGARGWSYEEVVPYFRRLEDWRGPAGETRGHGGPLPVSEPAGLSPGAAAFVVACEALGFPRLRDINDGPIEGAAPIQLNTGGGRRYSTARAYLRPARRRPNLRVVTDATACRVLIEGGRAVGVLARRGDAAPGREERFLARREVVLCAGAIASPQLLMLSGVGEEAALRALGIEVAADLPGVGRNLQDHLIARVGLRTRPAGTMNEVMASRWRLARTALGYALRRAGPLAIGAGEATLFAPITPGADEAEVQLFFINFCLSGSGGYTLPPHPGMMINFGQCRPESRGEITLRSSDPADRPLIRANYLDAPQDRRIMVDAARLARRVARATPFADLVEEELWPPPDAEDDDALLDYVRRTGTTVYHPCGTCRMGMDAAAVVDAELRLRGGVRGLRVADASVMPLVPSSNIQPAVMMVAERAADLIRRAGAETATARGG